jgi:hypothetical protein
MASNPQMCFGAIAFLCLLDLLGLKLGGEAESYHNQ